MVHKAHSGILKSWRPEKTWYLIFFLKKYLYAKVTDQETSDLGLTRAFI